MQKMLMSIMVLIVLLSVSLPAQIVIPTNTYNPSPGTILRGANTEITEDFYNTMTSGSGGGHLWDFSSILYDDEDSSLVVNVAGTPGAGTFPTANLCWLGVTDGDSSWFYSSSLPSSMQVLGFYTQVSGQDDYIIIYDDLAPDYIFPIAMNNSWVSHRHWSQIVAPGTQTDVYDSTYYDVDAYGQIKYASKSVNCLRIKSLERIWTITSFGGMPISTSTTEINRYDFVTADYLNALSVIKTVTPFGTIYSSAANLNSLDQFTPVVEYDQSALPEGYSLGQNFPNPFNPSTTISYALPRSAQVTLDIINIAGQRVKSFEFGHQDAGNYSIEINLAGDISAQLSSGVYFYKLSAGDFTQTRKMMLLK